MSKSPRIDIAMKREAIRSNEKAAGVLTNDQTLQPYRRHIDKFCDWLKAEHSITRLHQIEQKGFTARELIQEYTDGLVANGLRPTTVHTYIAPVCKGMRVGMQEIRKPSRFSADIVRNTKAAPAARGAAAYAAENNERVVRFCEVVGIRPTALSKLTIDNLVTDENGDTLIATIDKGGKESCQLIDPDKVSYVRHVLTHDREGQPLTLGKRPFSPEDIRGVPLSQARIKHAQEMEQRYEVLFNSWRNMPRKTNAQVIARNKAKAEADRLRKIWIEKIMQKYITAHPNASPSQIARYRKELERPSRIQLRGNAIRARELARPIDYDRLAVRITSVYALSHWEDESSLRNYLTK